MESLMEEGFLQCELTKLKFDTRALSVSNLSKINMSKINNAIGQNKINIEIRRSTTPGKRVILVQGPC